MISGIAIVGGNGSGKTTLGKYLAALLAYKHIDVEDYYFKQSAVPYADPRSKEEVQKLILEDIHQYGHFVLSAVNGDMGEEINDLYRHIVYLQAPLDIRIKRVKQRSLDKFGSRVLEGGDMFEQEQNFYRFVASRSLDQTDNWIKKMCLPVLCLDGTAPISDNIIRIREWIRG